MPRWQAALLWLGAAACASGLAWHGTFEVWSRARTRESLVLVLLALLFAWIVGRLARVRLATAAALAWLLLLPVFAGPLPVLAILLVAAAATALGDSLAPDAPLPARCAVGLSIAAGALGWLLPLPVHHRWIYLATAAVLVGLRWRRLRASMAAARDGWAATLGAAPAAAVFPVLLLGLASAACWVPTLQHDDVAYHLRLPWMLLEDGRHALDPDVHVWALAPWASDVVHALPQVLAGVESRGAVNALWLVLTASGVWRLTAALGGGAGACWWAVALYASLPLTTALGLGMQTEVQTTALLVWAAWFALQPASRSTLYAAAALLGALVATKLAAALFAAILLPWLAYRQRSVLRPSVALAACAIVVAIGGSSYTYAGWLAGNPFLPLFNAWFASPYFAPADFVDPRWHAGFGIALPWDLTFDTDRYHEGADGGGGFLLVGLAGAWLLALWQRPTRAAAALALAMMVALLWATQYLRYVQPVLVLAVPALVVAAARASPRSAHWLFAGLCALNVAFLASGDWLLRAGVIKHSVRAGGDDAAVFELFAPERLLARRLREERGDGARGNVLALDPAVPVTAEFGARGRTVNWYDPSLLAAAAAAERDPSGRAWAALLQREGIDDVLLRSDSLTPAQRAGLQLAGAAPRGRVGSSEWWHVGSGAGR